MNTFGKRNFDTIATFLSYLLPILYDIKVGMFRIILRLFRM